MQEDMGEETTGQSENVPNASLQDISAEPLEINMEENQENTNE